LKDFKGAVQMLRPVIANYKDPVDFARDMLRFRKETEVGFTVQLATKTLRRVSPTLVSLILKKKRTLTIDRAEEFAKLLALNTVERFYFKNWLERIEDGGHTSAVEPVPEVSSRRREVSTSILSDWLNIYVRDFFQFPRVQRDNSILFKTLTHIAKPKRIERAFQFLLREGYLRRTLDGRIVVESSSAVANPKVPSKKIREAHKGALSLARSAIDMYPPAERLSNFLIIPMNEKSYAELLELIEGFAEQLQEFAGRNEGAGDRLYQLIVNVSPVGGKVE
jgi:uncharacterized protein (TIGR02147 family)